MATEAKPHEVGPMKPEEVLRMIAAQRGSAICVPTMTTGPEWRTIAPNDLSVGCVGFMGGASSLGLGLELARPDRRVLGKAQVIARPSPSTTSMISSGACRRS